MVRTAITSSWSHFGDAEAGTTTFKIQKPSNDDGGTKATFQKRIFSASTFLNAVSFLLQKVVSTIYPTYYYGPECYALYFTIFTLPSGTTTTLFGNNLL
jgi:hypothetical protein